MNAQEEDEAYQEVSSNSRSKKGWSRFYITIEPIKFCLGFAMSFTNGATIDLLQRNICYFDYNLTEAQCRSDLAPQVKAEVEALTADVNMLIQVVQGIFPLLLIMFVGHWSDVNGRKPFIVYPLLGYSFYYLAWSFLSCFPAIPAWYFFLPSIPLGLTGSFIVIFVCCWSYTCDNFQPEERPLRFGLNTSCLVLGSLVGNSLAGYVVQAGGDYGYLFVFSTGYVVTVLASIYAVFILEETVVRPMGMVAANLFDLDNVKSTLDVVFLRPEKGTMLSLLVLVVLLCEIPLNSGDDGILYFVGKSQYNWNLKTYNVVAATSSLISAISPLVCIWFLMEVCKCNNNTVLVVSCSIYVLTEAMKALSKNQFMFWLSTFATKFAGFIGPVIDTELSYIVSESNMGKAFTMTSVCDALSPVISMPLYTGIYKLLLPGQTLYVFFLSAALALVALVASVAIFFKKQSIAYSVQQEF